MAKSCLQRHVCGGLFANYFERNKADYDAEFAENFQGFEDDYEFNNYNIEDNQSENFE